MGFTTNECAWKQISVTMLGRTFVGIRGFEFKKTTEKELIYGAGDTPIDMQSGNQKFEGHLKLLKYEVDLMNDAAVAAGYGDIVDVPHEAILISVTFKKTPLAPIRQLTMSFVGFTEMGIGMDQGAKMTEVTLPYIAMQMVLA